MPKLPYARMWHAPRIAPGLDRDKPADALIDQYKRTNVSIHAKVAPPSRVLKQQFQYVKVRYHGPQKNTAEIVKLFALGNMWRAREKLQARMGQVRLQGGNGPRSLAIAIAQRMLGAAQLPKAGAV